jgi:hypothetical protein
MGDDELEKALAQIRAKRPSTPPADDMDAVLAQARGTTPAGRDIHAEYRSGALAQRMARENAAEQGTEEPGGFGAGMRSIGQGLETTANSAPFVGPLLNRWIAAGRSAAQGIPFEEATRRENADVASYRSDNPRASLGLTAAASGAVPLGPLAQMGRAGGAILGGSAAAVQRFGQTENPNESFSDRLKGTAIQGGVGAGLGYVAPSLLANPVTRTAIGAGAGAYLAPEGHRLAGAAIGGAASYNPSATLNLGSTISGRLGASGASEGMAGLASAMGTRGLVNRELEGIDRLAKPLGTTVGAQAPGGQSVVAQAEKFATKSKALYDAARQSPRVLSDPKTLTLINDPDMRAAFQAVNDIRQAQGSALPQGVVGQTTLTGTATRGQTTAQSPNPSLRQGIANWWDRYGEAWRRNPGTETVSQGMARTALERHGAEGVVSPALSGAPGQPYQFTYTKDIVDQVPDPEALHLLKRIVRDRVDRGFNAESTIPLEDALRLQPKLQALTDHLHTVSPEFKAADRFFQLGSTAQEASGLGYGAAKSGMQNPSAAALGTKDVAGVRNFIASQGHADPAQDVALRATAGQEAQSGARNQLAQQLAAKGLSGGRAGVLSAPGLAVSGPAAEQRALALGSGAPEFENTLTALRGEVGSQTPTPGWFSRGLSAVSHGHIQMPMANPGQDAIASPIGQKMLADALRDPAKYRLALDAYLRGKSGLEGGNALLSLFAGQDGTR